MSLSRIGSQFGRTWRQHLSSFGGTALFVGFVLLKGLIDGRSQQTTSEAEVRLDEAYRQAYEKLPERFKASPQPDQSERQFGFRAPALPFWNTKQMFQLRSELENQIRDRLLGN